MSNALHAIKVALGADFLIAFSELPQKQQRKVRRFLDDFTANPDAFERAAALKTIEQEKTCAGLSARVGRASPCDLHTVGSHISGAPTISSHARYLLDSASLQSFL